MKRLLMASVIACAISITTLAGDIPSGGAPISLSSETSSIVTLGEISSVGEVTTISDAVLSALMTAFGLASI